MKDYVKCLNEMYNKKYYYIPNGYCKYYNECKLSINEENKFYSDRVKVGEKYGEKFNGISIPRIVFCGLEGVHDGITEKCIPVINFDNTVSKPSINSKNNHYKGVRYVLSYILSGIIGIEKPGNAHIATLNKNEYIEFLHYYCLTNIFKCAFGNKKSGLPHSLEMKNNCIHILLDEIDILKPDLFVIQVVTGRPPKLWKNMTKKYNYNNECWIQPVRENNTNTALYKLYYSDGTPFFCLWTYHGNGSPYQYEARFVNNEKYITQELNPVLDVAIEELRKLA